MSTQSRTRLLLASIGGALVFASGPAAAFQNGGFEIPEDVSPMTAIPWPNESADMWQGDVATIVTTENGITPLEGTRMLHFEGAASVTGAGPNGSCNMWQIFDAPPPPGTVTASAFFNRVHVDADTDTHFRVTLVAVSGAQSGFPTKVEAQDFLAFEEEFILTDALTSTWESASVSLKLPDGTDYFGIHIAANENIVNDEVGTEFDGHYADAVTVSISHGVPTLSSRMLLLMVLAFLGAGLVGLAGRWRTGSSPGS